jgi:diacylglycerol kinase (ATP)
MVKDRKFIYLINPVSGTRGKALLPEVLKKETSRKNISFEILHSNAEGDYDFIVDKIRNESVTDVIVCGGDGTFSQVARALQGIEVNLGIIPMGSGNGLALAANIPKRIDKALEILYNGKAVPVDGFRINKEFSCMLCGLGFDAQVAHDFARQKKRGLTSYIRLSIKNFFRARLYPFTLSVKGQVIATEAYFISIANSNQFGNNFTIAPQASLHDGLLDIVVVNKMSRLRMLWTVLMQISKGQVRLYEDPKYHRNKIHYFQTRELKIGNPELAPLHIDGDPAETSNQIDISVIPKAFRLLMPA